MSEEPIPENIRQFIVNKIDSIAHLEAILLFHSSPEHVFQTEEIANRLYVREREARALLKDLEKSEFIIRNGDGYQYRSSPDLNPQISELSETYARCLIPTTRLIHEKASKKIQQFANAFKFRED